jgi:uncharacterized protein YwgA
MRGYKMTTSLSQKEIRLPERSAILLFALNRLGEIYTEIKLQKLIFQVQNKAKVPNGYGYFKHYYGPYSKELNMDTFILASDGLIQKKLIFGDDRKYWKFEITDKGRSFYKECMISHLSPGLITKMSDVLDKYSVYRPNQLAKLVYQEWKLDTPEKLKAEIPLLRRDIDADMSFWEAMYFSECPNIANFIAYLEYCQEALEKVESNKDSVIQSVLIGACQELRNTLSGIGDTCARKEICQIQVDQGICNTIDTSIFEVFHFIEDFCSQSNLLPKLCDRQPSDLLSEEEYKRLQEMLKTESSCSSL